MPIEPLARDLLTAWELHLDTTLTRSLIAAADLDHLHQLQREGGQLAVTLALARLLTPTVALDLHMSVSPMAGYAVAGWWTVGTEEEPLFAALGALGWSRDLDTMNAVAAGWLASGLREALTTV
ncbi:hypothetical protein NJBCHELONAE_02130 [Mycobacteroides chelonae]|uniref:hypothetical protein n=1 Tax=Mycobacteroides chelonae TaxID=1774 RepID=UPI0021DD3EE6|nr:hypothetical protein [Mycobacteroides chelonae]GLE54902.1 hypothetical protein NJBCHELONAE_02130 [Mycobacteroides chelonae]